jgi:hypothetical protein
MIMGFVIGEIWNVVKESLSKKLRWGGPTKVEHALNTRVTEEYRTRVRTFMMTR